MQALRYRYGWWSGTLSAGCDVGSGRESRAPLHVRVAALTSMMDAITTNSSNVFMPSRKNLWAEPHTWNDEVV